MLFLVGSFIYLKFNDKELIGQDVPNGQYSLDGGLEETSVIENPISESEQEITVVEQNISDSQRECEKVEGTWKYYSNTCVDSCSVARMANNEGFGCGAAFTWGCDCGEDKCWNGNTCELN